MVLSICFSLFSGVLYFLSFPPAGLNFLAWIFLVPLFYAAAKNPPGRFFYGFLAGLSGFCLNLYWIYPTVRGAGESFLVSFGALFLLSAVLSFFPAVFTLSFGGSSLFVAASGTILSFLRGIILTGFPWCALYVSQAESPLFLQITGLAGPHFLTFVIIFFNHSLFSAVCPASGSGVKKRKRRYLIYALVSLLLPAVFGIVRINRTVAAVEKKIFIGQLNIPQDIKWGSASAGFILERIKTFVLSSKGADLVVFPESCLPGVINYDREMNRFLLEIQKGMSSPVLLGAAFFAKGNLYNTAVLLSLRGEGQTYLKRKLVPFGEFVPFKNFFSRFVNVLNEVGDFTPGTAPGSLKADGLRIIPLICNEIIFPSLWRGDGNLIVNISNNAWYGKTAAAEQHLWHARAAAAATGLPVIFSNNRGPSAVIDARGKVLKKTEMFSDALVSCDVQIPARASFYQRTGDLFILLILIMGTVLILLKKEKCEKWGRP